MTACFFCLFLSICLFTSIYLCSSSLSFSFISNKNISIPSVVTRDTFSSITFPSQMTDAARRKAENHCLPIRGLSDLLNYSFLTFIFSLSVSLSISLFLSLFHFFFARAFLNCRRLCLSRIFYLPFDFVFFLSRYFLNSRYVSRFLSLCQIVNLSFFSLFLSFSDSYLSLSFLTFLLSLSLCLFSLSFSLSLSLSLVFFCLSLDFSFFLSFSVSYPSSDNPPSLSYALLLSLSLFLKFIIYLLIFLALSL
ncbi:unnamed protein product [Acanthosepion pharaonis]|uniref:Uncharacterized protein n=1 Tax=Acanthosepion pharaonis TaxID=158019 RepID=A0A812E271_ACAPH|nr:unnamed protein product [Sepia pharaonis]